MVFSAIISTRQFVGLGYLDHAGIAVLIRHLDCAKKSGWKGAENFSQFLSHEPFHPFFSLGIFNWGVLSLTSQYSTPALDVASSSLPAGAGCTFRPALTKREAGKMPGDTGISVNVASAINLPQYCFSAATAPLLEDRTGPHPRCGGSGVCPPWPACKL